MRANAEVVALQPHPDDLAFSVGAALWAGRFGAVRPLTIFDVSAFLMDGRDAQAEAVTELRAREDERFFAALPQLRAQARLGFLDAPLRLGVEGMQTRHVPLERDAATLARLVTAMAERLGERDILLAPLALGDHIDHLLVHEAAAYFARCGRTVWWYEDLPYAEELSLQAIYWRARELMARIGLRLYPHHFPCGAMYVVKEWVTRCYASQTLPGDAARLLRHAERMAHRGMPSECVWVPQRTDVDGRHGDGHESQTMRA